MTNRTDIPDAPLAPARWISAALLVVAVGAAFPSPADAGCGAYAHLRHAWAEEIAGASESAGGATAPGERVPGDCRGAQCRPAPREVPQAPSVSSLARRIDLAPTAARTRVEDAARTGAATSVVAPLWVNPPQSQLWRPPRASDA